LVKAAIGENIDNETLGGSISQTEISGVIDDRFPDDKSCLERIKFLVDKIGHFEKAGFDRKASAEPTLNPKDIYGLFPTDSTKTYDSLSIIQRLVDNSEFEEYKKGYGQTILCGYARIDGWAVGIVANNRKIVKSKKGEMQFGGVIYSDSADKAARFVMVCNQKKIPLVFLQDVTGFMVGSKSEHGGIIKDGAKLVNAMSNSTVPKFTIVMGNSYGAGNYAMCGKAYDPRLIYAWPTAKIAVMGGEQAAKVLLQIEKAALESKGQKMGEAEEKELLDKIVNRYNKQTTPYYAASRLWVDGVIDPMETRKHISMGIEMANNAPVAKYNVGVLQT
jgi:acetyl-CoA carboxylase carboxyltransferase component